MHLFSTYSHHLRRNLSGWLLIHYWTICKIYYGIYYRGIEKGYTVHTHLLREWQKNQTVWWLQNVRENDHLSEKCQAILNTCFCGYLLGNIWPHPGPERETLQGSHWSGKSKGNFKRGSDPSIPGLVTIVLNTYFIDMMMLWLWFYRLPGFVWNVRKSVE